MNGFEFGANRAIEEIIGGFVTSVIVYALVSSGLVPPGYIILFGLINVIGIMALLFAMPFWGYTHLLGWMFGVYLMLQTGLIGILETVLYAGVPIAVLILKVMSWFE